MVEFRKLISFGKTSYVMSIPKSWVLKNNLKKGDLISLEEKEGSLILSSKSDNKVKKTDQKKIIISIDKKNINRIKRETASAYINSFNPIVLTGKEITEKSQEVRDALGNLIALEVMEQGADKMIAKDFLNMDKISIIGAVKKMDIIIRSMISDSKTIKKEEDYLSIYHRDKDVNRLSFLIYRAIKNSLDNPEILKTYNATQYELIHCWLVTTYLEKIADTAKRIARNLKDSKGKNKEKILQLYATVELRYLETMKAFYNKNIVASYQIADNKREIMLKFEEIAKNNKPLFCDTIDKLQQMISDIHDITRTTYLFLNNANESVLTLEEQKKKGL